MVPQMTPSTPPSAQLGTEPGSGGSGAAGRAEVPGAAGGEVGARGAAGPAGADAQHLRVEQFLLPLHADLRQDQVPLVAVDLLVVQLRDGRPARGGRGRRGTVQRL